MEPLIREPRICIDYIWFDRAARFIKGRSVILLGNIGTAQVLATDPLLPIRIVATIAFIAMVCAFMYVLRHLRKIEKTIVADQLIPTEVGARNNLVLMVCLIPLIVTALLLYLIIKT